MPRRVCKDGHRVNIVRLPFGRRSTYEWRGYQRSPAGHAAWACCAGSSSRLRRSLAHSAANAYGVCCDPVGGRADGVKRGARGRRLMRQVRITSSTQSAPESRASRWRPGSGSGTDSGSPDGPTFDPFHRSCQGTTLRRWLRRAAVGVPSMSTNADVVGADDLGSGDPHDGLGDGPVHGGTASGDGDPGLTSRPACQRS